MVRLATLSAVLGITAIAVQLSFAALPAQDSAVTFNKDVLPILQKNCQTCHRPGEVAPMSLLTYEAARPWAKAMKQAVLTKQMPPWFADPKYGEFRNEPKLTDADRKTLAAWADAGAPEGDLKDKPAAINWPDGWHVKPDLIVSMPEAHRIAAKGSGEIKAFLVANPFKEDTWVSSIEIRPGNPSVVHHVILQVPDPASGNEYYWGSSGSACLPLSGAQALYETPVNIASPNSKTPAAKPPKSFAILESVYVPGAAPSDFQFNNSAKLIPGGGKLRIEVHYTPNGTATSDQTRIGFVLAKKTPERRFITLAPKSIANVRVRIPAGEGNWETRGELEFAQDAQLVWLMPHMHLRGKDMTFSLVYPNGRTETILSTKFNFHWQFGYELDQPIAVRKGTRMVVVAHHDNSANNPFNPDPTKEVAWGNLTSEEMMLPWFGVVVNKNADPEKILAIRQGGCGTASRVLSILTGPASNPGLPPAIPGLPARKD